MLFEDQYPMDKRKPIVEVDDNRPQWEAAWMEFERNLKLDMYYH